MKKILGMIALSAALCLSTSGYAKPGPGNNSSTTECTATSDIIIKGAFSNNDMGGDTKLTGTLFNSSAVKNYEDVNVKIEYYSNEKLVRWETHKVGEDVVAGEIEDFTIKLHAPEVTDRISWYVVCADKD